MEVDGYDADSDESEVEHVEDVADVEEDTVHETGEDERMRASSCDVSVTGSDIWDGDDDTMDAMSVASTVGDTGPVVTLDALAVPMTFEEFGQVESVLTSKEIARRAKQRHFTGMCRPWTVADLTPRDTLSARRLAQQDRLLKQILFHKHDKIQRGEMTVHDVARILGRPVRQAEMDVRRHSPRSGQIQTIPRGRLVARTMVNQRCTPHRKIRKTPLRLNRVPKKWFKPWGALRLPYSLRQMTVLRLFFFKVLQLGLHVEHVWLQHALEMEGVRWRRDTERPASPRVGNGTEPFCRWFGLVTGVEDTRDWPAWYRHHMSEREVEARRWQKVQWQQRLETARSERRQQARKTTGEAEAGAAAVSSGDDFRTQFWATHGTAEQLALVHEAKERIKRLRQQLRRARDSRAPGPIPEAERQAEKAVGIAPARP